MPIRNGQIVGWERNLKIKHLFSDDGDTQKSAIDVRAFVTKFVDKNPQYETLRDIVDQLDDDDIGKHEFNGVLDELYDYCDENLIWVE